MEDIRMAKALGMSPKTLMKNNPSPSQRWKLPVKEWIRELYEKRFGPRKTDATSRLNNSAPRASAERRGTPPKTEPKPHQASSRPGTDPEDEVDFQDYV